MKLITAVVSVLIVTSPGSRAELPPQVYQDYQARSPEALTITVKSVTVSKTDEPNGIRRDITVEASVQTIQRSATHLRVGDTIRINYSHYTYKQPMPGPGQPEIVAEGRTYSAYLAKSDEDATYALAAGGHSFSLSKAK
jgi:hypothetical protein